MFADTFIEVRERIEVRVNPPMLVRHVHIDWTLNKKDTGASESISTRSVGQKTGF